MYSSTLTKGGIYKPRNSERNMFLLTCYLSIYLGFHYRCLLLFLNYNIVACKRMFRIGYKYQDPVKYCKHLCGACLHIVIMEKSHGYDKTRIGTVGIQFNMVLRDVRLHRGASVFDVRGGCKKHDISMDADGFLPQRCALLKEFKAGRNIN